MQEGEREVLQAMFKYYKYLNHSHFSCPGPSVAMVNTPVCQKQFLAGSRFECFEKVPNNLRNNLLQTDN